MPEPASAFSVRRESKTGANEVCASTSAGTPSRPTRQVEHRLAGPVLRMTPLTSVAGRSARGSSASAPPVVPAVDGCRERRGPGSAAERVDHVDDRLRVGVDEVERLPVAVGQVREVVHRLGDVVDRHHVGVAEVDADQRQPGGQGVPHPLHHREEVVGPVDLVHRPGLGVADHDRGPVDPPRHRRLGADDLLRLVLRAVVRRGQVLALVEHRLVEDAVVVTGGRHRRDLVEAARPAAPRRARGRAGCRRRSAVSLVTSSAVMS